MSNQLFRITSETMSTTAPRTETTQTPQKASISAYLLKDPLQNNAAKTLKVLSHHSLYDLPVTAGLVKFTI